ncbi:Protein tyrosine/serine phosphatase [Thermomonospora echinospora]|uniref:Protein tyrosine/serine phosphatase n=1 Tax=Thermomonospora echinospora TaxID=1992 RepID=A0A1H6D8W2_9ACTN|nr:tyrosine-protein phosphatase [Thermomonospora echinospora]SEG81598.1 Protein tyrosine/serine phosphatase [Thermomonospora echinospora]
MSARIRWIELDGAVNVRDLGGLITTDGRATRFGRVLRSDNLQGLTHGDLRTLLGDFALSDVIDLRSDAEVRLEGPGPLTRVLAVTIHHLSLFAEGGRNTDVAADTPDGADPDLDIDKVLPWQSRTDRGPEHDRSVGHYLGYLQDRADSVVAALRVMARTRGAALVHCAAGKDRTGVVCALALDVAGVHREHIVADYAETGLRLEAILDRLRASETYAADLDSRPADSHRPEPAIMEKFLTTLDERFGGTLGWLADHGWTEDDTAALRSRLLD